MYIDHTRVRRVTSDAHHGGRNVAKQSLPNCPCEAIIQCPISYVVVPIVDLSVPRKRRKKPTPKQNQFRARAKPKPKPKGKPKKQGAPAPTIVCKKWPVYTPRNMLNALGSADALHLVILVRISFCANVTSKIALSFKGVQYIDVMSNWSAGCL